jgi:hypothetical protein
LLIIPGNKYMRWELVSFFSGFFSIIAINARNVPQKFLPCLFSSPCNCFHFIPQWLLRCLLFRFYMSWQIVSSCDSFSNSIIPRNVPQQSLLLSLLPLPATAVFSLFVSYSCVFFLVATWGDVMLVSFFFWIQQCRSKRETYLSAVLFLCLFSCPCHHWS